MLSELLQEELLEINAIITGITYTSDQALLKMVINHITSSGGKRLRPMLTIASNKIFDAKYNQNSVFLGAAVEFIHTATILHDDVIDQSPTRRGRSTANILWGNKASVLVGDYLFSQAFNLMTKTAIIEALECLAQAAAQIAEAEVWQLELIGRTDIRIEEYIKLITHKTAVLFAAACKTGAIAAGAAVIYQDKIFQYGLNFGIVFQILDDFLDYFGEESVTGKNIGSDFFEKKLTLPLLLLLQSLSLEEKQYIITLVARDDKDDRNLKEILQFMENHNIAQKVTVFALHYLEKSLEALEGLPNNNLTLLLKELVIESMHRMR